MVFNDLCPQCIRTSCEETCSGSIDRLIPDVYQNILLGYNQTDVCLWLPRKGCSKMHALAKVVAEKKDMLGLLFELFFILKYFTTGV